MEYSSGIFQFILLVINKKTLKLVHHIFVGEKIKNRKPSSSSFNEEKKYNKMLLEINQSHDSLGDSGLFYDLFEQITQKALIKIFIALTIHFIEDKKVSKKKKKIHIFYYEDLEILHEYVNFEFLLNSKIYLVPVKNFYLIEYFPQKFHKIRQFYSKNELLLSLLSPYNYHNIINLLQEQGGRSGAFIFATNDKKFIIKTITSTERKFFLRKILPKYMERVLNCPESKLARILGVFKIYPMNQDVIIMENILINKESSWIFDLKGSKVARLVKNIENPLDPPLNVVLKDENFLISGKKIYVNEKIKEDISDVLKKDFLLLKECGVIDYSLLLAISNNKTFEIEMNVFSFLSDDQSLISIGIIDIFQEYNFWKACEKNIKMMFHKRNEISIAKPDEYYRRIYEFIPCLFGRSIY